MTHRYQIQQDIILRKCAPPDFLENAMAYQPSESDSVIVGYPRSGTSWVAYIINLLKNEGQSLGPGERLWEQVPEIGVGRHVKQTFGNYFVQLAEMAPHPRVVRTHLPYDKAPIHPLAKCIYISRNPYDTAVSLYNELCAINEFEGSFDDFFSFFLHSQMAYNDYFEHHKGWLQRKTNQHVLWITFEDLKTYPKNVIKQIGDYLGGEYQRNVLDEFILQEVIRQSSFVNMKLNENILVASNPNRINGYSFFTSGLIGEYKKYFSEDHIKRLTAKYQREFGNTLLYRCWERYQIPPLLKTRSTTSISSV